MTGKSEPSAHAYKFQGGPILVRVAVYNDWEFEGLGQRRTVLASQSYFPPARSAKSWGEAMQFSAEYIFARHSGLAVVIDDGQFRVALQRRSSISRNQFRVPDRFSRTDVRLQRSFTIEQLRQNSEYTQGFRTQAFSQMYSSTRSKWS